MLRRHRVRCIATVLILLLAIYSPVFSQAVFVFQNASSTWGSATTNNWGAGVGIKPGSNSNTSNNDIAQIINSGTVNLQINFASSGSGVGTPFYVGAIDYAPSTPSSGTNAWTFGSNAGTAGLLNLNTSMVNGQSDVYLWNRSASPATWSLVPNVSSSGPMSLGLRAAAGKFIANNGNTINITALVTGTGGFVKEGGGNLILANASNNYQGKTTVSGGNLTINNEAALGQAPGTFTADQLTLNGGTLRANTTTINFTSNRGITLGGAGGTFDSNGQGIEIANVITGVGSLTKINTSYLSLTAANTYSGNTNLQNGETNLYAGNDRLPVTTVVTLGSGSTSAVLAMGNQNSPINQTITGLTTSGTGTGNAVVGNTATGKSTLTVNNAANYTFDGKLGGTGNQNNLNLVKSGPGTLTLSGNNSYTGTTTVNGGTLLVNGSHSSSDTYTINGGTLGGTGAINADVTVFSANLAPGSSTGILTINGNVTLSSTSTFAVELNGITPGTGYDQLAVGSSGALDLGGATLQLSLGFAPLSTDKFFIIANQSGAIANTFDNLPDLSTITIGSYTGNITYFGDLLSNALTGGNDVVIYNLVSIPEPSTFLLIGLAGFFGAQWYLRRKPAENKNDKQSENASTESTPAEPAI